MSESLDRRTLLKGAAASAAAMNPLAEAFGAQADGLQFDPPVPFTYELFKTQARDRAHATLRAAVSSGARGAAEDQLRGMGKNPLPRRLSRCSPTGLADFR